MRMLRFRGRGPDGKAIWEPIKKDRNDPNYDNQFKTQKEQVMQGYKKLEERGGKSAYTAKQIKKIWAV